MSTVCEHVPLSAGTAVAVTPTRPTPQHVAVRCPCCGLTGWDVPGETEPNLCPYCDVQAVPA